MKVQKAASVAASGEPSEEQLAKINLQAKGKLRAEDVYVFSVRLCDDKADRDFERFSTESLKELAALFIGKTGIVDHAWSAEKQVARIFDTAVEYEQGCAYLKAWAYILRSDKTTELIREIEGGIKKEVSVGCAMGKSICSICGAEYGSCQHRKGEAYGGEICVAILCEPKDAYEFSFVAVPAQPAAGVVKGMGEYQNESLEVKALRKDAALGKLYRKKLEEELVRAALVLDLGVKEKTLRNMAAGLSAEDLMAMQEGLEKKAAELFPVRCQLTQTKEIAQTDSAFLI